MKQITKGRQKGWQNTVYFNNTTRWRQGLKFDFLVLSGLTTTFQCFRNTTVMKWKLLQCVFKVFQTYKIRFNTEGKVCILPPCFGKKMLDIYSRYSPLTLTLDLGQMNFHRGWGFFWLIMAFPGRKIPPTDVNKFPMNRH